MPKPLPIFVEYVVNDILPNVGDYVLRPMMGAYLLRYDGLTFSILDEDQWYLRTIPETESWYTSHNCEKFNYTDKKGKTVYMPYHRLPESVYEDHTTLKKLIDESIIAARIAKQSKK